MVKKPTSAKGAIVYAGTKIFVDDINFFHCDVLASKATVKDELPCPSLDNICSTLSFQKLERLFTTPPVETSPDVLSKWSSLTPFSLRDQLLHKRCSFFPNYEIKELELRN